MIVALIVIGMMLFAIVINVCSHTNRLNALHEWAQENRYKLVNWETRLFFKGPFFFSGKHQRVYYVTVRTIQGETRNAFVRVGRALWGIPYRIDVRWE